MTSTTTRHQVAPTATGFAIAPRRLALRMGFALLAFLGSIAPALHAQITNNSPRLDAVVAGAQVNAVVEMDNVIYFGGAFTEVGTNIGRAIMTDTNGAPYYTAGAGFPRNVLKFDNQMLSVIADGQGGWYVGGSFFNVSGTPRLRLARVKSDYTLDSDFVANLDAAVQTLLLVGTNLYVGGDFTRVTNMNASGVNTATNSRFRFAVLNPTNGSPRSFGGANGEPSFDSSVVSLAVGAADNNPNLLYIGGAFVRITNSLLTDGMVGSGAPGGNYSNIATNNKFRMAALDLTTGLPTSFQADLDSATTRAIVSHTNGAVYIGGDFVMVTNAGTTYSNWRLAKLDGLTGAALTNTSAGGLRADLSGRVRAMVADGDNIFVGGDFTTTTNGAIASDTVNRITNINNRLIAINTNGVISTTWTPQLNNVVLGLYQETNDVTGTNLYVVGSFTQVTNFVGGTVSIRRRAMNITRDTSVTPQMGVFDPNCGGAVYSLAPGNLTNVFFGGDVYFVNAQVRNRLAAVDPLTGGLMAWNPNANNTVLTMAKYQNGSTNLIYAGGQFTTMNGTGTRNRIAALNTDGTTNTLFINGANNIVRAIVVDGTRLYVGGDFTSWFNNSLTANSATRGLVSIAVDNGLTNTFGNGVGPVFTKASGSGATTNIQALAVDGAHVYVGGGFSNVNATPQIFGLVALDKNTGVRNSGWAQHTAETNAAPLTLAVVGTNVFVGGQFTTTTNTVGGVVSNRARLMSLSPTNGNIITNFTAVANAFVTTIVPFTNSINQTNLLVGGNQTIISMNNPNFAYARNRLAELTSTTGRGVTNSGFAWNPDFGSIVNGVSASANRVAVGGQFTTVASASVPRLASVSQLALYEATNAAPTLTGAGGSTSYTNPGDPVTMDDTIVVRDANHNAFNGAAVSVSGNFVSGEDFLSATAINGVTNSYDTATGVLTISGGDNVGIDTLQAVLRTVKFYTAPDPTSIATRTISFVVQDKDGANSAAITRNVAVSKLNAPPTLNVPTNVVTVVGAAGRVVTLNGISDGGNGSQTVTVTATSSDTVLIPDPAVSFISGQSTGTLTFATPSSTGTATITVTVQDSGGATDTTNQVFLFTVVGANQTPTLDAISNLTIQQDTPPATLNFTGVNANGGDNGLTVTAVSSDTAIVVLSPVNYTSDATSGSFTYSNVFGTNGTVTVEVVVSNLGGGADRSTNTFTITVSPNSAPAWGNQASLVNLTVNEDPGTLTNLLTGISAGAGATRQTVTATVSSSNPGLVVPSISYTNPNTTGVVTYTPRASASGSALITVTLTDDGGTANGGANSTVQTFVLTVNGGRSDLPRTDFPQFNAQVNAVLETNGIIFLGGNFSEAGHASNVVGKAAWVNNTTGAKIAGSPILERNVNIIIPDGSGGWYVGGEYLQADSRAFVRLIKVRSDLTIDENFSANMSGAVTNLFLHQGTNLIVVGGFTSITNVTPAGVPTATNTRVRFAVLNYTNGTPRSIGGANGEPSFNLLVESIAVKNDTVFVGGDFTLVTNVVWTNVAQGTTVATNSRVRFAAIDLTSGLVQTLNGVDGEPSFTDRPRTLLFDSVNDRLYVGGLFARITNSVWTANVEGSGAPGGNYSNTSTNTRVGLAVLNGSTGATLTMGDSITGEPQIAANGTTWAFALTGTGNTNLIVAGAFHRITNVVWSGVDVGTVKSTVIVSNMVALQVSASGGDAVSNGMPNRIWQPFFNAPPRSMVVEGSSLYVVGGFTVVSNWVGNTTSNFIFKAVKMSSDVSQPNVIDTTWNPSFPQTPLTIASDGAGTLAVGGDFNYVHSVVRSRLAAVSAETGELLPWAPWVNNNVYALAMGQVDGTNVLYAGGVFTAIGDSTNNINRGRVAALSTNVYETQGTNLLLMGWTNQMSAGVRALTVGPAGLYVGGEFVSHTRNSGGGDVITPRIGLAALNLTNGGVNLGFVSHFYTNSVAPGSQAAQPTTNVQALAYDGTSLFVGGAFGSVSNGASGEVVRFRLASIDPASGNVNTGFRFDLGIDPNNASAAVNMLLRDGTNLYVGGDFGRSTNATATNTLTRRLAAVDPTTGATNNWGMIAGSQVYSLAASGTNVYVGGSFTSVTNANATGTAVTRNRIAEVSTTPPGMATPWNPSIADGAALAMVVSGSRLYVGGSFSAVDPSALARFPIRGFAVFELNSTPSITTSGGAAAYAVGSPGEPVDPGLTIVDPNNYFLVNATVSITNGYISSQDVLSMPANNYGIAATWNSTSGVLTLTNRATLAQYQAVLRSVTYSNSSTPTLTAGNRVVEFKVDDDFGTVGSAARTVGAINANVTPTFDNLANMTINEDQANPQVINNITDGGDGGQTLTFTITSSDTALIDPVFSYNQGDSTASLNLTPLTNAYGESTITIILKDNGGTANGAIDAKTNTFKVTVNPYNDAPTLNALANLAVAIDAPLQTINLSGISVGGGSFESAQTLAVTATSTDTSVVPHPTVNYTSANATGSITFTPVASTSGTVTVTVTVTDSGNNGDGETNYISRAFQVRVEANSAPRITTIDNVTTNPTPGLVTVSFSGVDAGADAYLETVTSVTAASSDTGLIPDPTVTYTSGQATGQLSFTPVPANSGTATITVTLTDDGGTSGGGVNSLNSTFTVTVTTNAAPALDAISNMTVSEDSTQNLVLTGIGRGSNTELGFNESGQSLSITATVNAASAYLVAPVVTYTNGNVTGGLNITPRPNAYGTATISVIISDNGGTVGGGVDSRTNTFTMAVVPTGLTDGARRDFPMINGGNVFTLLETNGVLYIGGSFTDLGTNMGRFISVNATSGMPDAVGTFPYSDRSTTVIIPDGNGGWFLGGAFTSLDGKNVQRLAHLNSDGSVDPNFSANFDSTVNALMLVETNLYVGGQFNRVTNLVNGVPVATNGRIRYAVLNYTNGEPRSFSGLNGEPLFPDTVLWFQTNVVNGTNVMYVGHGGGALITNGYYTNLPGQAPAFTNVSIVSNAAGIAALDRDTHQLLPGFSAEFSSNVRSIIVSPDNMSLYVGGDFVRITNREVGVYTNIYDRLRIAKINAVTGVPETLDPLTSGTGEIDLDSAVRMMILTNNILYVSGDFVRATNAIRNVESNGGQGSVSVITTTARFRIMALDVSYASTGATPFTAWDPNASGAVYAMMLVETNLYIGGQFGTLNNSVTVRRRAARISADPTVAAVADGFDPVAGNTVVGFAQNGADKVWMVGDFNFMKSVVRTRLAAINADTGEIYPWDPNADNEVRAMIMGTKGGSNVLYAGGLFTSVGSATHNRIVALGTNVLETAGVNIPVPSFIGSMDNAVRALATDNTNLFVGGDFASVTTAGGGAARRGVAGLDLVEGKNVGTFVPPNFYTNGYIPTSGTNVLALAFNGTNLYVGGAFGAVHGGALTNVHRPGFVALNPASGAIIGAITNTFDNLVTAILPVGNKLYVAGGFTTNDMNTNTYVAAGATRRSRIAVLNPDTGENETSSPGANARTYSMVVRDTNLYFGGVFATVTNSASGAPFTGNARNDIAEMSLSSGVFSTWNPGTDGEVYALGVSASGNRLYVGGSFSVINVNSVFNATTQGQLRQGLALFEMNNLPVITPSAGTIFYTALDPATPVDTGIIVTDYDTQFITNATVSITSGYMSAEDVLALPANARGITSSFNSGTGVLTLSGYATFDAYQAVARTVTYYNSAGGGATDGARTVTFTVSDYLSAPVSASRNVIVSSDVNGTPTLDALSNLTFNEDQIDGTTVSLTGITAGTANNDMMTAETGQIVTVTVSSSNPSLISPVLTYTDPNTTGSINVAPSANASGTATITVVVRDNGGTGLGATDAVTNTFEVVVQSVNDAPTLNTIPNRTVLADGVTRTIGLFGIGTGGGSDETSGQSLSAGATSSDTALIPSPVVSYADPSSTGSLQFTPAVGLAGTVTITVTVADNGGTLNSGVDSVSRTFTVTVVAGDANDNPLENFPAFNGQINAMTEINNTLYVGGTFTEVGTNIGKGLIVSSTTGNPLASFAKFPRDVNAIIPDGSGGWYIGGAFDNVDRLPYFRLVHILSNRTVDANFVANLDSTVNSLALSGTNLYVGGAFVRVTNMVNGTNSATNSRVRFAVLDPVSGAVRSIGGANGEPSFDSAVLSISKNPASETLYVGGDFVRVTNVTWTGVGVGTVIDSPVNRTRVAALDVDTASLNAGKPTAFVADATDTVRSVVAFNGGTLVALGGNFLAVSNSSATEYFRRRLAVVDATTGQPSTFVHNLNNVARTIVAQGGQLYVGGDFTQTTNSTTNSRARLIVVDGTVAAGTHATAWVPGFDGAVRTLFLAGGDLYVGGDFQNVTNFNGGSSTLRRRAAAFSSDYTSAATLRTFNPDVGGSVLAIAYNTARVYLGGNYNYVRPALRNRLAAINANTGELLPWDANANSTVLAIAPSRNGDLYIGGAFTTIGGLTRNRIALVSASSGSPLLSFSNSPNNTVRALAVGDYLYLGGDFTNIAYFGSPNNQRVGLAALNLNSGALYSGFMADCATNSLVTGAANTNVNALVLSGSSLYAGGLFHTVTNADTSTHLRLGVVKLDATTGNVDPGFVANVSGINPDPFSTLAPSNVLALAISETNLFIGGTFSRVWDASSNFTNRNRLVAVDAATGNLVGDVVMNVQGANGANWVTTLNVDGTNLYAGGQFTSVTNSISPTGTARNRAAAFSTTNIAPGTNALRAFYPDYDTNVYVMQPGNGRLYVGGAFTLAYQSRAAQVRPLNVFGAYAYNALPVVTPSPAALAFTSGSSARYVDADITLTDADNATLLGVTVNIPAGYRNGEDVLSLTPVGGISGTWDAATGRLTLTGGGTAAAYQTALQNVEFSTAAAASPGLRTVRIETTDILGSTVFATRNIQVTASNLPPVLNAIANLTILEDAAATNYTINGISSGDGARQIITMVSASSDTALVPHPTASYTNYNSTGFITLQPEPNQNGLATLAVVLADNGGTSNGGVDASTNTFTVTVTAVNDAPTIDPIADQTINENSSPLDVNISGLTAGPANESAQLLTVTATSSDTALVTVSTTHTNPDSTGKVTVTPVLNANGTATITVTVQDDGGTANGGVDSANTTFVVAVLSVNSQPTLTAINNMTIYEDDTTQTVNLEGITAGSGESGTLTVTVASSDTAIIPTPSLTYTSPDSTGSISFAPTTNQNGVVTISVTVQDDGGTANGGVDTLVRTFTVTVNPVNDVPTLNAIANFTTADVAGATNIPLSGISAGLPSNESGQNLTVTATANDTAMFSAFSVAYTPNNATGSLNFTPIIGSSGTVTVTVVVQDDGGTTAGGVDAVTNTFTLSLYQEHAPVAADQTLGTDEETAINVILSATDEDGDALVFTILDAPARGSLSLISGDTNYVYTPARNFAGIDTFTFRVTDPWSIASTGTVTIYVTNTTDLYPYILSNALHMNAGSNPVSIVSAKFYKKADIAVANYADNTINVYLGTGGGYPTTNANSLAGGLFTNASPENILYTGNGPVALATADLNGDKLNDLAVVNKTDGTVTVYFGNGLGGFGTNGTHTVGTLPTAIAVANVNGDPFNDLLVANGGDDTFTVLFGPDFNTTATFAVGDHPSAIAVGDFNKDMKLDVATANYNDNTVSVLHGNKSGFFSNKVDFAVGQNPTALLAFIFSKSGRADLVTANYGDDTITVLRSVLVTNGFVLGKPVTTNTFVITNYPVAVNPSALATTDLNKDKLNDLVIASYYENSVSVMLGKSNTVFEPFFFNDPSAAQTVGTNPISLVAGVFNADMDPDVAVANWGSGNVSILLNNYTPLAYALKMNVKENTLTLPEIERSTWITLNGTYGPLDYIIVSGPTNGVFVETNGSMSNALVPPQLRYQANTQMNGKDLIVFYVREVTNNVGTITNIAKTSKWAKVELTILPVNDPPNFDLASNNVNIIEDAKKTSVTNFAVNLDRGSGLDTNAPHWKTEKGDGIVFRLTNNMSNLFKAQPSISDKGLLVFEPLPNVYGTATVGVVMYDKGKTINGGKTNEPSYDKSFTISIIQSNDTPTINKIVTITNKIKEDTGGSVVFVVNDVETAREDLTYRVINITNTTLFPDVSGPSVDAGTSTNFIWGWSGTNRTLTFYPAADQYGTNYGSIQVDDGTNSVTYPVAFSVESVNDAPSFTPGGDVNISGIGGSPQTISGWATGMSTGPANESAQTLTFVVATTSGTLFTVKPAISNALTGNLTFTPKPGVVGTFPVTVYLKDNGSSTAPSKATSTTNTFNIIITP